VSRTVTCGSSATALVEIVDLPDLVRGPELGRRAGEHLAQDDGHRRVVRLKRVDDELMLPAITSGSALSSRSFVPMSITTPLGLRAITSSWRRISTPRVVSPLMPRLATLIPGKLLPTSPQPWVIESPRKTSAPWSCWTCEAHPSRALATQTLLEPVRAADGPGAWQAVVGRRVSGSGFRPGIEPAQGAGARREGDRVGRARAMAKRHTGARFFAKRVSWVSWGPVAKSLYKRNSRATPAGRKPECSRAAALCRK
jgi:hypothetical protein